MYMYKPEYKNEKYFKNESKKNKTKESFAIMGYAALSMLLVGIPLLLF
jgi:hypothetical protein